MKYPSLLIPSAVPSLIGLLLISSSHAEDAKTKFANGVKVEVAMSRPSKTGGGDFDDKTQIICPRIKMTNTTTQQDYTNYKAVFIVLGESTMNRKITKVLLLEEFPVNVAPIKLFEKETANVETMYDTTGAKFGYKYDSWIIQITDSKGEIVYTKSSSSIFEKMPREIQAMEAHSYYDKKLKEVSQPSLIMRR